MLNEFQKLLDVVDTLLGENGCPWDRAQTHQSLRRHLMEECYECLDAIDQQDMQALSEELGDVLLHVVFHARLAERDGNFNLEDVVRQLREKLIRRHTHIFGEDATGKISSEQAELTWEANKHKEHPNHTPIEHMRSVPKAMPALLRAQKVVKRSPEEISESHIKPNMEILLAALFAPDDPQEDISERIIGKLLLYLTAISEAHQINAELALANAVEEYIEECAHE